MPEYASVPTKTLTTFPGNPRRGRVEIVADSLRVNGQYRPIVVNKGSLTGRPNEVLAGNHTLLAARSLSWETIDCAIVDVDETAARRIVAADNRTSDLADYDNDALLQLLEGLDGDLDGTGFVQNDIDALLVTGRNSGGSDEPPEDFPTFDDDIETDYCCPKCGYEWSGKPA